MSKNFEIARETERGWNGERGQREIKRKKFEKREKIMFDIYEKGMQEGHIMKESDRETKRQRKRETEKKRDKETEKRRKRETEKKRVIEKEKQRGTK